MLITFSDGWGALLGCKISVVSEKMIVWYKKRDSKGGDGSLPVSTELNLWTKKM
jgi:hypothetical protein